MLDLNDNVINVRDIIERFEELEGQRTERYVAGWNMPGYMPDNPPEEFDNADDAREHIADEMERYAEELEEGDEAAADLLAAAAQVREGEGELGVAFGKFYYFVKQDGHMGLDDDDTEEFSTLESLLNELEGCGGDEQWRGSWYPLTLIRDSYFETAMGELLEDCGDLPKDLPSYLTITVDYDALRMDYGSVEIDGETYWYR